MREIRAETEQRNLDFKFATKSKHTPSHLLPEEGIPSRDSAGGQNAVGEESSSERSDEGREILLFEGRNRLHTNIRQKHVAGQSSSAGGVEGPRKTTLPPVRNHDARCQKVGQHPLDLKVHERQPSARNSGLFRTSSSSGNDSILADYIDNMEIVYQAGQISRANSTASKVNEASGDNHRDPKLGSPHQSSLSFSESNDVNLRPMQPLVTRSETQSRACTFPQDNHNEVEQLVLNETSLVVGAGQGDQSDHQSSGDRSTGVLAAAIGDIQQENCLQLDEPQNMTDEQIAKRLAKQEELGLSSAEIVLFDGSEIVNENIDEDHEADEVDNVEFLWEEAHRYVRRRKKTDVGHVLTELQDIGSGTQQYGDFDIMDRERPSLQPRKKHRAMSLQLSDSELESEMLIAWDKDRSKKKARKQQREALRAEGLLGSKGSADLNTKYPQGMVWDDVRAELRLFLMSNRQT